jgi:hypothetical protein
MNLKRTTIAVILISTFSLGVQAAEPILLASLSDVNGKVMVNKGKGYVSARSGTTLDSGDRVIALNGSNAVVSYSGGCTTELKENSLLTIEKGTGCGKPVSTGASKSEPLRYAQAIGNTATDAGGSGGTGGGSGGGNDVQTGLLIGGGVLLGAIIIHNSNKNGNNRPISGM